MSLLSVFISEAHVCLTFRVLGPSLPPSLADEKSLLHQILPWKLIKESTMLLGCNVFTVDF